MTTITVTKKHIRMGRRGDPERCPVAMAICEMLKPEYPLHVHANLVKIKNQGIFGLPKSVEKFIGRFDFKKSSAEPFSFKLALPKEILK